MKGAIVVTAATAAAGGLMTGASFLLSKLQKLVERVEGMVDRAAAGASTATTAATGAVDRASAAVDRAAAAVDRAGALGGVVDRSVEGLERLVVSTESSVVKVIATGFLAVGGLIVVTGVVVYVVRRLSAPDGNDAPQQPPAPHPPVPPPVWNGRIYVVCRLLPPPPPPAPAPGEDPGAEAAPGGPNQAVDAQALVEVEGHLDDEVG